MIDLNGELHQRLTKTLESIELKERNDGLIIKIDNNTVYRFGVDGEDNINKFDAEKLILLETVLDTFGRNDSERKEIQPQKLDISLYFKATLETFAYENGHTDIKKGKYTIGDS